MKIGTINTPVPCDSSRKAAPAFAHLLRQAGCGGMSACDDRHDRIDVIYVCSSAAGFRKLRRSVDREVKLLKRHRLAGRKKK
ncbi:MAG: hypothetical protein ACRD1Z_18410 [Vicinamibacteria bacterium]